MANIEKNITKKVTESMLSLHISRYIKYVFLFIQNIIVLFFRKQLSFFQLRTYDISIFSL